MSETFNKSGYKIPASKDTPSDVRVQTGGDKDSGNFILDAESMGNYLSDIERPTYEFKNLDTPEKVNKAIETLHKSDDLKGIIAIEAGDKKLYQGTGHVDLIYEDFMWDLSLYGYGSGKDLKGYLMDNLKAKLTIKVWVLEQDNK